MWWTWATYSPGTAVCCAVCCAVCMCWWLRSTIAFHVHVQAQNAVVQPMPAIATCMHNNFEFTFWLLRSESDQTGLFSSSHKYIFVFGGSFWSPFFFLMRISFLLHQQSLLTVCVCVCVVYVSKMPRCRRREDWYWFSAEPEKNKWAEPTRN